eukprot:5030334-Alexandrium_andersonii.AAC.1
MSEPTNPDAQHLLGCSETVQETSESGKPTIEVRAARTDGSETAAWQRQGLRPRQRQRQRHRPEQGVEMMRGATEGRCK